MGINYVDLKYPMILVLKNLLGMLEYLQRFCEKVKYNSLYYAFNVIQSTIKVFQFYSVENSFDVE